MRHSEWGRCIPTINENWLNIILSLVKKYPSLYTDISYTLCDPHFTNYLKVRLQDEKLKPKYCSGRIITSLSRTRRKSVLASTCVSSWGDRTTNRSQGRIRKSLCIRAAYD